MKRTALLLLVACSLLPFAQAEEEPSANLAELKKATQKEATEAWLLKYKFSEGETVRWKVTHLATTETKIKGNTQTSKSRSVSTKSWTVSKVDAEGNTTFTNFVDNVDMWQSVSDRDEVRYNSETDETPPAIYEGVAKTVGVPLATITINSRGEVIKRDAEQGPLQLGMGEVTLPLPAEPVKIGQQWSHPEEIQIRTADKLVKKIKTRHLYTLEDVQTGIATIRLKTEVLTPITDPREKSQLIQRLTSGEIKFDLDAGRLRSKEINWDEKVVGFNTPDSIMQYLARFTEEILSEAETDSPRTANQEPIRATRDSEPVLRRE